jgi:hypothetical protein
MARRSIIQVCVELHGLKLLVMLPDGIVFLTAEGHAAAEALNPERTKSAPAFYQLRGWIVWFLLCALLYWFLTKK